MSDEVNEQIGKRAANGELGRVYCPMRARDGGGVFRDAEGKPIPTCDIGTAEEPDGWLASPNGEHSCSYCGSMEPQELVAFLGTITDGMDRWCELNDGRYKLYVHRPEVKNAAEGPIKFYIVHDDSEAMIGAINEKLKVSNAAMKERVEARLRAAGVPRPGDAAYGTGLRVHEGGLGEPAEHPIQARMEDEKFGPPRDPSGESEPT